MDSFIHSDDSLTIRSLRNAEPERYMIDHKKGRVNRVSAMESLVFESTTSSSESNITHHAHDGIDEPALSIGLSDIDTLKLESKAVSYCSQVGKCSSSCC